MNAKKFTQENGLQNVELEIGGKRESIQSILERFQTPIQCTSKLLEIRIHSMKRLMETNPMSPMTEMEYLRKIENLKITLNTLLEL
tara:strand:+ start:2165 stop:2422 length:258 start_codon:yes stop_codon:yes gene_type:complete